MKKTLKLVLLMVLMFALAACTLVACSQAEVKGIKIEGATTEFKVGEAFSHSGLKISAVYSDGTVEEIADVLVDDSAVDASKAGTYTIKVTVVAGGAAWEGTYDVLYTVGSHAHTFGEWTVGAQATCDANGYEQRVCACGAIEKEVIYAKGHTFGELIAPVAPTCVRDGVAAHYECDVCHKIFNVNKIQVEADALVIAKTEQHVYGNWTVVEPTCTAAGLKYRNCLGCGKAETAEIPAAGHALGSIIAEVPATCSKAGVKAHYQCAKCLVLFNEALQETTAKALAIKADASKHGINLKFVAKVEPTCEEKGVTAHYECADCGEGYFDYDRKLVEKETLEIAALGHEYGEIIAKVDSTCCLEGKAAHYICSVCNEFFTEEKVKTTEAALVIAKKPHNIVKTDYQQGSVWYHKEVCTLAGCTDTSVAMDEAIEMVTIADLRNKTKAESLEKTIINIEGVVVGFGQPNLKPTSSDNGKMRGVYISDGTNVIALLFDYGDESSINVNNIKQDGGVFSIGGTTVKVGDTILLRNVKVGSAHSTDEVCKSVTLQSDSVGAIGATWTDITASGWFTPNTRYTRTTNSKLSDYGATEIVKIVATIDNPIYFIQYNSSSVKKNVIALAFLGEDGKDPTSTDVNQAALGSKYRVVGERIHYTMLNLGEDFVTSTFGATIKNGKVTGTTADATIGLHAFVGTFYGIYQYAGSGSATSPSYASLIMLRAGMDLVPMSSLEGITEVAEVPATCASKGMEAHWTLGGKLYNEFGKEVTAESLEIATVPHTLGDVVTGTPAACTHQGRKDHYVCSGCNGKFVLENEEYVLTSDRDLWIDKLPHTPQGYNHACSECGEPQAITSIKDAIEQGKNGDKVKITGQIIAKCTKDTYKGVYFGNGEYAIQVYGAVDFPANPLAIGDVAIVTGTLSYYEDGRCLEITSPAIERFSNPAMFPSEYVAPVAYTFDATTWASLTSSEICANNLVTNRLITVVGIVKTKGASPVITVDGVDVKVYTNSNKDSAAIINAISGYDVGDKVSVTGIVGSYKGATQIICPQESQVVPLTQKEKNQKILAQVIAKYDGQRLVSGMELPSVTADGVRVLLDQSGLGNFNWGAGINSGNGAEEYMCPTFSAPSTQTTVTFTVKVFLHSNYGGDGSDEVSGTFTMIAYPAGAKVATKVATISFADISKRTSVAADKQEWCDSGITFINYKNASTMSCNNGGGYYNPIRCYTDSYFSIGYTENICKVVITCYNSDYATALGNNKIDGKSGTVSESTVTYEGLDSKTVTLDHTDTTGLRAQVRIASIDVYVMK